MWFIFTSLLMALCHYRILLRLPLLHSVMTHRLSLADQKLVELLQQGRFSDNLPAHVGVPGLLIRIPGGNGATFKVNF